MRDRALEVGSLFLALNVCVQRIVDRKLPGEPLFIRETHLCKSLSNGAQTNALRSHAFLPSHIRSTNNQRELLKRCICEIEVFDDCFEAAPRATMIKFHGCKPRSIEGSCLS